jgi:DNA modification methylase
MTESDSRTSEAHHEKDTVPPLDSLLQGDCIKILKSFPGEWVDLIFADPPFNIGKQYDDYDDHKTDHEYLNWTRNWLQECVRVLKATGSLYIAIGDEFAGDIRALCRDFPLHARNWIVWYYTFGQNMKTKFNRSHTHILYFVKDPKNFTFNADDIRVPSARQRVYRDKRAHPKGKVPDDVWQFSRVCGTFKERIGKHPCQMPEDLLERIIRASSHSGEIVLDPFAGTGTTLAVAHRLKRRYIGIEMSTEYIRAIHQRLKKIRKSGEHSSDSPGNTH